MESSQDWLVSQGFEIDHDRGVFKKGLYEVPFSDLGYYSPDSLRKRLKDKGWVSDVPKSEDDTVPYPFGNWVIWQYGMDCI